jgi:chromosome segregation ATPase
MLRNFMEGLRRGRDMRLTEYAASNPWADAEPGAEEAGEYDPAEAPAGAGAPPQVRSIETLEGELRTRTADLQEKVQLLGELANYADGLKARIAELEAMPAAAALQARVTELETTLRTYEVELKEKRRQLAELASFTQKLKTELEAVPDAAPLKARIGELEAELRARETELVEKRQLLIELAGLAEQLKAELAALPEDTARLCAEVLRLPAISTKTAKVPSVRNLLADRFHPAKHPKADEDALRALNEATQKINRAYDAIKRERRPPGA